MSGNKNSLLTFFIDEMTENLEKVSSYLLDLEASYNDELINKIFRVAHTMKGSAAMMGYVKFSQLAHHFEDILGEVRAGNRELTSDLVDSFFELIDIFKSILHYIGEGFQEDEIGDFKKGEELLTSIEVAELEVEEISLPEEEVVQDMEVLIEEVPDFRPTGKLKKLNIILEEDIGEILPLFKKELLIHLKSINKLLRENEFSKLNAEQQEGFLVSLEKKLDILSEVAEMYNFPFMGDFFLAIKNKLKEFSSDEFFFFFRKFIEQIVNFLSEEEKGKDLQNYAVAFSSFLLRLWDSNYRDLIIDELKKNALLKKKKDDSLVLSSFLDELEFGYSSEKKEELSLRYDNKEAEKGKEIVAVEVEDVKIKENFKAEEIKIEEKAIKKPESEKAVFDIESLPKKSGEKLAPDFINIFLEEGKNNISFLKENIHYLEEFDTGVEKLEHLIRSAHTIKGSAAMVGLTRISSLGKALEFLFKDVLNRQESLHKGQIAFLEFVIAVMERVLDEVEKENAEITLVDSVVEDFKKFWDLPEEAVLVQNKTEKPQSSERKLEIEKAEATEKKKEVSHSIPAEVSSDQQNVKKDELPKVESKKQVSPPKVERRGGKDRRKGEDRRSGVDRRGGRFSDEGAKTVRVGIEKLDSLINLTGELVINKIRIDQKLEQFSSLFSDLVMKNKMLQKLQRDMEDINLEDYISANSKISDLQEFNVFDEIKVSYSSLVAYFNNLIEQFGHLYEELLVTTDRVGKITVDLQEDIMKIRMFPIDRVFSRFPRVVRDLAKETGKEIDLVITGENTELDKTVIEKIGDPLMHLIRNAVDHGIETPEDRVLLGKDRRGTIRLNAYHRGNNMVIEVEDDGRGIDIEKIKEKALKKGIVTEKDLKQMSEREIMNLIFVPGFSTKAIVSDISGRGVGMDVVRNNIMALKGTIDIFSEVGKGTKIVIRLPLTLAIIQALIVGWGEEDYVIPINSVVETTVVYKNELKILGNKRLFYNRGEYLPLLNLGDIVLSDYRLYDKDKSIVVVVTTGEKVFGIEVEKLKGKHEIVVKSLGYYLKGVKNISSATILGDGRVLLILDIAQISRYFNEKKEVKQFFRGEDVSRETQRKYKILVVDDSPTVRSIEKNLLENAGYEVICAENGLQAYEILKLDQIDMVISDVEMPKMNGFELTQKIRSIEQFRDLPIIIITTKVSDKHKRMGLDLGANLYLGKPFEQDNLLKAVRKLLNIDK